jgi:release factor glutamine methyltransferase
MLIFFGNSGDVAYLQQLIDHEGFQREVLPQRSLVRDGLQVDYFTFRLTG